MGPLKSAHERALSSVLSAFRELEEHEFFLLEEQARFIERAEMCVRLLTWLIVRPDEREAALTAYRDAEVLIRWYAEEGGFVDLARRRARNLRLGPLAKGAAAVLAAADSAREELDKRFASGLSAWIRAGRPSYTVLPIDQALKRIAHPFLTGGADRSLLIVLMDGMAWAQAVELLPSLASKGSHWGPLAWHSAKANKIGDGAYPAMIAALPTVTEVSRTAFLAGKVPKNGTALDSGMDPARFAENPAMRSFFEPHLVPRLLLRGEGHTSDGTLSDEAVHMINAVKEERIVALVVNAIDASLKSDSQEEHRWDIESIRSLRQIFQQAMAAGRCILMAADHGHVPSDRLKPIGSVMSDGARWRPHTASDAIKEGEYTYSGEGVYVPKGAEGVSLLAVDSLRYGGGAHAGAHGGAGLAEVVAPCMLLGWEDELRAKQDPDLAVRGLYIPDWWTRSLPDASSDKAHRSRPPRGKAKKEAPEAQLGLPMVSPSPNPAPEPAISGSQRPEESLPHFYNSDMLKARAADAKTRATVVAAVHFLLQRSGAAPAAAFAAHLNEPAFRVAGVVSKLQEVLNLDGYYVLTFDRVHQQIFLDREKLEQQFEVKL